MTDMTASKHTECVIGQTPSDTAALPYATEAFMVGVFKGTAGLVTVGSGTTGRAVRTREFDEVASFVATNPDADTSLTTVFDDDDAMREVVGIGTLLLEDELVANLPLAPSVVLSRAATTDRPEQTFAIWLLDEPIDLERSDCTALEEISRILNGDDAHLGDVVPLPGVADWQLATDADDLAELAESIPLHTPQALVAAFTKAPEAASASAERLNDAELHGQAEDCPDGVLDRPLHVYTGKHRAEKVWREWKGADWSGFLNIMSNHPLGKSKDGPSIVGGQLLQGNRNRNAVARMSLMMLDSNSGQTMDEMADALRARPKRR